MDIRAELAEIRAQIKRSKDYEESKPGGMRDWDYVSLKAPQAWALLKILEDYERQQAVVDAAGDFVTVLQEDHDLSRPVVLPGELDTLIDALAALKGAGDGE